MSKFLVTLGMAAMLALMTLTAAPAPPASVPPKPATGTAAASAAGPLSDIQIERDLKARIARSKLAANKFQVHVQGGIATLEGKTDVVQHKGIMTRMAKASGARAVVNRIEISAAARQKAAARLEAGRKRAQVRRAAQ